VRARGPGARRRGRRVGVEPELDPGSVAIRCGGGRIGMTGGARPSISAGKGGALAGHAGPESLAGLRRSRVAVQGKGWPQAWAGTVAGPRGSRRAEAGAGLEIE
jgi:hypothetical protein